MALHHGYIYYTSCLFDTMLATNSKFAHMGKWPTHTIGTKDMFSPSDQEQGKSEGFDSCDRPSNLTQIGFKSSIFHQCDLEIWWMIPKNKKTCLLYNIKLCVSFHIHQWIKTGVTVQKHPIWVKLEDFFSRVTLQFHVWPWETIGHLFNATSSFVHHFVAIGE